MGELSDEELEHPDQSPGLVLYQSALEQIDFEYSSLHTLSQVCPLL